MLFHVRSEVKFGRRALLTAALFGGSALTFPLCAAPVELPGGGTVAAGQASIGTSGTTMTITQGSAKAIVDWNSFSIGAGGTVTFQNGTGATLNRVTGGAASSLNGLLSATGSVYLINPNGVVVGKSGVIDTGGTFVASTLNVADGAFLAGGPLAFAGTSTATVVNLGKVGSLGGDVALIATTVANAGAITAPNGAAGLIAGAKVVLTDASLDGGRFAVTLPTAGGSVTNSGLIAAATAELRANGGDVYALAGNTAGVIRATGVDAGGGRIWLVADGGTARIAGTLEAQHAGGTAGAIETSGATVEVGQAGIDAHGGTWTLDPVNLTIDSTAATTISNALATSDVVEQTSATAASGTGTQAAGAGDITLASGAAISWSSARALTLSAYHDVSLLGTIAVTGAGSLTLRADNAATGSGTVKLTGAAGEVTLASGATANIYYNPTSYTDTATRSTQQAVAIPQVEIYTNPYSNPYDASNPGATVASSAPVMGGTVRAYMLVNSLAQLGGGLTGVGSQLNGLYALNTDIDATTTKTANPVTGMAGTYFGFIPIGYTGTGNNTNNFTGVFDGQGHTISNVYINHFTLDSNGNKQGVDVAGIFGAVTGNDTGSAFVANLNVLNATVIGSGAQNGIVAGIFQANAVGSNLVTSGTVNGYRSGGVAGQLYGGKIENSHSSATINAGNFTDESGGLVGELYGGAISGSYATGAVTGRAYVGGLVGSDNGSITNSYATGAVTATGSHVAGLAGSLFGTATNDYATGSVTDSGSGVERVGGFAGDGGGTWTNVYETGAVTITGTGANQIGGLVGRLEETTLTNAYATGALTIAADTTTNNVGSFGGLIGRAQPGFTISNSFATGAVNVNGGSVGGLIGTAFAGSLSTSYASGAVSGLGSVGGLIGASTDYGKGAAGLTITDSYATGSVTGTGTAANAGATYIGGLIGSTSHDEGTTGATTTITRSYATGLVSGNAVAGGLVGRNAGVISNSIWDRTSTGQANGVGATQTSFGTSNPATISVTNLTSVQDTNTAASDYAFSAAPYAAAGFGFGTTPGGSAAAPWVQGNTDGTLNGGSDKTVGTRPFLLMEYATSIINAHQLQLMEIGLGANYTLGGNVDASITATPNGMWGPAGFVSVGSYNTPFTGSFDGKNHVISGLFENAPTLPYTGLFGVVSTPSTGASLRNVTLANVNVTGNYVGALAGGVLFLNGQNTVLEIIDNVAVSGKVTGAGEVGGLLGQSFGAVSNARSSAAVVLNSALVARPSGSAAGGLCGLCAGPVSNATATGTVTALTAGGYVGGLVGFSDAIASSSASGAVINGANGSGDTGGLVGFATDTISDSFATGAVTGGAGAGSSTGGLVGLGGQITRSYATGNVGGSTNVGGLAGVADIVQQSHASGTVKATGDVAGGLVGAIEASSSGISDSYASGAVTGINTVGGLVGEVVVTFSGQSNQPIVSQVQRSSATGSVTATGNRIGGLVGYDQAGAVLDSFATGNVSGASQVGGLVGLAENFQSSPVLSPSITGSAAGKTYASGTVTGTGTSAGGVVGVNQGTITNVAYTNATGGVTGNADVGGVVGLNAGLVSASHSTGQVGGTSYVGGLVGYNYELVTGSDAKGPVSGTNSIGGLVGFNDVTGQIVSSTASGPIRGANYLGGLAGYNSGMIDRGTASGQVSASGVQAGGLVGFNGGTVSNSSAGGTVSAASFAGGLLGSNGGTVTSSSATSAVGGGSYVGGLAGKNDGSVSGSHATGAVTATAEHSGGLVGLNTGSVSGSYASGNVAGADNAGGLVGANAGSIQSSYATGQVGGGNRVGGLVGINGTGATIGGTSYASGAVSGSDAVGGLAGGNSGMIADSSATGKTGGVHYVGGLVGNNDANGSIANASAGTGAVSGSGYVGGLVGYNDGTIDTGTATAAVSSTGGVTGGLVGQNNGGINNSLATGTVTSPSFTGGLVGENAGKITLSAATGAAGGTTYIGGLAGKNDGTVSTSKASGAAAATGDYAGGLVGWNAGTLSQVDATGAVSGRNGVGGLVGINKGPVSDAYASGSVTGAYIVAGLAGFNDSSIARTYAAGKVIGTGDYVAGFVGFNYAGGTLNDGYWDVATTGMANGILNDSGKSTNITPIGGMTGRDPTAQSTYVGFDFANTWTIKVGSRPILKNVSPRAPIN